MASEALDVQEGSTDAEVRTRANSRRHPDSAILSDVRQTDRLICVRHLAIPTGNVVTVSPKLMHLYRSPSLETMSIWTVS